MFIPKITLMLTKFAFGLKRVQFPASLAFAILINKSQRQCLEVCGIKFDLPSFLVNYWRYLFYGKTKNILESKALK